MTFEKALDIVRKKFGNYVIKYADRTRSGYLFTISDKPYSKDKKDFNFYVLMNGETKYYSAFDMMLRSEADEVLETRFIDITKSQLQEEIAESQKRNLNGRI